MAETTPQSVRFWNKTHTGTAPEHRPDLGPCQVWHGASFVSGYGKVIIGGKRRRAHIVAWELVNGPVHDGLELDHLCRNKPCVRPTHLEPVDHRTNTLRAEGGFASLNARKTHCPRNHPYSGSNVRVDTKGRRRCRACAAEQRHRRYLRTGV